jgi:hypothetical protein
VKNSKRGLKEFFVLIYFLLTIFRSQKNQQNLSLFCCEIIFLMKNFPAIFSKFFISTFIVFLIPNLFIFPHFCPCFFCFTNFCHLFSHFSRIFYVFFAFFKPQTNFVRFSILKTHIECPSTKFVSDWTFLRCSWINKRVEQMFVCCELVIFWWGNYGLLFFGRFEILVICNFEYSEFVESFGTRIFEYSKFFGSFC